MIRKVEVYQLADGRQFPTREKAAEALADQCREALSERLKPLLGPMTNSDLYKIVMTLIPDDKAALSLSLALDTILGEL